LKRYLTRQPLFNRAAMFALRLFENGADAVQSGCNALQQEPMKEDFPVRREKGLWSACPNCSMDLKAKEMERRPQYLDECPFCGGPIVPVWWWSTLRSIVALVLALTIPAYLGLGKGVTLVFIAVLVCFPALLLAQIVVITIIPPKYVRKSKAVTTLFQR